MEEGARFFLDQAHLKTMIDEHHLLSCRLMDGASNRQIDAPLFEPPSLSSWTSVINFGPQHPQAPFNSFRSEMSSLSLLKSV